MLNRVRLLGSSCLGFVIATSLLVSPRAALAQVADPDPREAAERASTTALVTVITREEIERRQWRTVAEVLGHQPGLHASQLGGTGQRLRLFFRGQRAGRVLLRLDGIEISDPLSKDPGIVVPDLMTVDVDRIEIRRGPQNVLYGSDAVGGVIDIYTTRGVGPASPWARLEGGSFGTFHGSAGISGGDERVGYSLSYSNLHTRGVPAAREELGRRERDGYENDSISGRLDFDASETVRFSVSGRFIDRELETDTFGLSLRDDLIFADSVSGFTVDDETERTARQLFLKAEGELSLWDERWVQRLALGFAGHDRKSGLAIPLQVAPNAIGILGGSFFDGEGTDGRRVKLSWDHELRWSPEHRTRFGLETERESIDRSSLNLTQLVATSGGAPLFPIFLLPGAPLQPSPNAAPVILSSSTRTALSERARNYSVYAQQELTLGSVSGEIGVRVQDHDEFGSRIGYRAGLAYLEPATQIRVFASIGTGLRDPDLALAGDSIAAFGGSLGLVIVGSNIGAAALLVPGNPDLEPEIVRGIEAGAEIPLPRDFGTFRVAYFATRSRNVLGTFLIGVNGQALLFADDSIQARAQGVETSARLRLADRTTLELGYTYTSSEVRDGGSFPFGLGFGFRDGEDELGIPKHLVTASLSCEPMDGLELVFGLRYVGKRKEETVPLLPQTQAGFTTFDFAARYEIREGLRVFGRILNVSDKDYNDPFDANGPERAGFVGVEVSY